MHIFNISFHELLRHDAFFALISSCLACIFLVLTKKWHRDLSVDTTDGVQKFHEMPTPRIGGVSIVIGVLAGYAASSHSPEASAKREILAAILLAGIPAFIFGLLEDLTKKISVRARLLATMASGVIGWGITGFSISHVDIPGVDYILGFTFISVLFTAFAVGGVANSINIIDGFNGLSAGASILMVGTLGLIARQVNDIPLAFACLIIAFAILGFLILNWPLGKIFLGDGGAYFVGFSIAWLAVLLPERNADVSPWTSLLVCAYPIVEVGVSYIRKSLREGYSPGQPDGVHLHMLLNKRVVRKIFPNLSLLQQNSLTSPLLWLLNVLPCAAALVFFRSFILTISALIVFVLVYVIVYGRLVFFKWGLSK